MLHDGFSDPTAALDYIFGGNAKITLTSGKTGKHYTYKIRQPEGVRSFFVCVLDGPDNTRDYQYIGFVPTGATDRLVAGRKGKPDSPSYQAFDWALSQLHRSAIPADLRIQHEGSCCRCGRTLTRPESIASGIGPECAKKGIA